MGRDPITVPELYIPYGLGIPSDSQKMNWVPTCYLYDPILDEEIAMNGVMEGIYWFQRQNRVYGRYLPLYFQYLFFF